MALETPELLQSKLLFLPGFFRKISPLSHRYCAGITKTLPATLCAQWSYNSIMVPDAPWLSQVSRGLREVLESYYSLSKELEQTCLVRGGR